MKEGRNEKIVRLYAQLGLYDRAIKYIEDLLFHHHKYEYYFLLNNLYIMSENENKLDYLNCNYKELVNCEFDFISMISKLNNSISNRDKFKFVYDYVTSKGATPVFAYTINRGKRLKVKSKEERELLDNQKLYIEDRAQWCKNNTPPEYIKSLYRKELLDKFSSLFGYLPPIIKATKVLSPDFNNGLVSVSNGLRCTKHQPENPDRKVLIFGSSTTFSTGMSDEETLATQIQKLISKYSNNISVENHGVIGLNLLVAMNNLVQTEIKHGDIVLFFDFDEFISLDEDKINKIDLNDFDRRNDFFIDLTKEQCHFSPRGNRVVAKSIFDKVIYPVLENQGELLTSTVKPDKKLEKVLDSFKYYLYKKTAQTCESEEIKKYLDSLTCHVSNLDSIGSIAVNCNPITNGHMHLMDYASKQVDKLFIFVIEEDLSFFKFRDRLQLVTDSTRHLDNVTVLPGGKFICTELTYPDYFDKDAKSEVIADASMEAWFFCEFIAKTLNISKIFLGDEPTCKVTKQYNQKMQELLPEYNIEVDIIERISTGGRVISASTVRKLLKERDFDAIKPLVPTPTYEFLKANY